MKIKVCDSRDKIKEFEVDGYEENSGVLTLYLSNGSIIEYGPYDWYSCERVED